MTRAYPSFAPLYWLAWLATLVAYTAASWWAGSSATYLGWYALLSCVGAAGVFLFELGRLMDFLNRHFPSQRAVFPRSLAFGCFAFAHPALWRQVLLPDVRDSVPDARRPAHVAFRAAYAFCAVALVCPAFIAWWRR